MMPTLFRQTNVYQTKKDFKKAALLFFSQWYESVSILAK